MSFSSVTHRKIQDLKNYIKSDNFEEDLDVFILYLQTFDYELDVPNLDKLKKYQRVSKKIRLVRNSFLRLNAKGALVGSLVGGPNGAAIGAGFVTGSFTLLIAKILYDRATSGSGEFVPLPI